MKIPNTAAVVLIVVFTLVIFFAIGASLKNTNGGGEDREPRHAYLAAREFCKKNLKSPSTAKFTDGETGSTDDYDLVASRGDAGWQAGGYVDSQNSFGAMIRSRWSATVRHVPGGWELSRLVIGGELIYEDAQSNAEYRKVAPPETEEEKTSRIAREAEESRERAARDLAAAQEQADRMAAAARAKQAKTFKIVSYQLTQASNGLPSFQFEMGRRYLKGDGVETNALLARHWLHAAATNGLESASNLLSSLKPH